MLEASSAAALQSALAAIPLASVVQYTGQESMATTLRMFADARAVVGVHGAGLANALFALAPVTVLEIGTYLSPTGTPTGRAEWRSNGMLALLSPAIDWILYRLPYEEFVTEEYNGGASLPESLV